MFLGAVSLALFADVLFGGNAVVASADNGDTFAYFVDMRSFGFGELARGNLVLWNPYVFSGAPFLAGFQSALLYPLNWIYLFVPVGTAVDLDLALHVFLAAWWTTVWVRARGVTPLAAVFAGCVLAFGSAFFLRVLAGQLTLVAAMAWSPLLLLAVDRSIDRPGLGWTLVGIAATSLMILAGYPAAVYATGVAAGLSVAAQVGGLWRQPRRVASLAALAAIAVVPVFVAAAQLWPGLAVAGETLRAGGVPFEFATSFSLPPENLLTLLTPTLFGDVTLLPYWGRWYYWDAVFFVGITGLLLAIHGALRGGPRQRRGAPAIALVLTIIALGHYTPVYAIVHAWIPGFDAFRAPSKFAFQASLFVAMLAGVGADRLLAGARGARGLAYASGGLAAFLAIAALWARSTALDFEGATLGRVLTWMKASEVASFSWRAYTPPGLALEAGPFAAAGLAVAAAVCALAAGLLFARRRNPRAASVLIALGLVEVVVFAASHRDRFELEQIRIPLIERQARRLGPHERFYYSLAGNRLMQVGAHSVWGYDPVMMGRYGELFAASQPGRPDPISLTVHYPGRFHPVFALLRCRFHFDLHGSVADRLEPMPRFALLRDYRVIADPDERLETLLDPGFDWRRTAILEAAVPGWPHRSGEAPLERVVEVLGESTDHVDLAVELEEPALLLVTDAYSRGWRARSLDLDGPATYEVRPADHALRAIPLGPGAHRIRLEYAPPSVRAGLVASGVASAGCLGALGVWWWRRSPAVHREDASR